MNFQQKRDYLENEYNSLSKIYNITKDKHDLYKFDNYVSQSMKRFNVKINDYEKDDTSAPLVNELTFSILSDVSKTLTLSNNSSSYGYTFFSDYPRNLPKTNLATDPESISELFDNLIEGCASVRKIWENITSQFR